LSIFDLVVFLSLIVLQDKLVVFPREALQALLQAFNARFQILVKTGRGSWQACQLGERLRFFGTLFVNFQQHSGGAKEVAGRVANLLSLVESFCYPIDGFIGVVFRERTATPFKESDQNTAKFQVLRADRSRSGSREASNLSNASWLRAHF
jgi:hypothetical protein